MLSVRAKLVQRADQNSLDLGQTIHHISEFTIPTSHFRRHGTNP